MMIETARDRGGMVPVVVVLVALMVSAGLVNTAAAADDKVPLGGGAGRGNTVNRSMGRDDPDYLTSDRAYARRSLPEGVFGIVPGARTTTLRGRISTSATTSWAT